MKQLCKRLLIILMCSIITISSITLDYKKAYAMGFVVVPEIGITVGQIVTTLLVMCGVGIAYDNRQELEAAANGVFEDFVEWNKEQDKLALDTIDGFINDCKNGYIDLQGEFSEVWQAFKEFVVIKYYSIGFDSIVSDNRPDITDISVPSDLLGEFLGYYTDSKSYPYYFMVDRTNGKGLSSATSQGGSSIFVVFTHVPLLYMQDGNLKYIYVADGAGVSNRAIVLSGYTSRTGSADYDLEIKEDILNYDDTSKTTLFSYLFEHGVERVNSNIPVFSDKQSAVDWWTSNTMDGVISLPNDIPVWDIPETAPDVIWGRDEDLDAYDVIGGNSYIDENGHIVPGAISVPNWDDLVDVNNGAIAWDDFMNKDIPIDKPLDGAIGGALDGALDIPIGGVDEETGEKPVQKPVSDSLPSGAGLSMFLADLRELFPFCIPFDLIDCIRLFNANAEAPRFEWTLKLQPFLDYEYTFVIDLAPFEEVAVICRAMFTILFIVGLGQGTRKLIGG